MLPESRERGYKAGRFSFNVKGGRCEACQGDGLKRIEMNFLPDVYVTCDVCRGTRYNSETLQVKYKGLSIADLLETTIEEAWPILENIPLIRQTQNPDRRRPRLYESRPVVHHAFRRRGATHQARQRTEKAPDRPDNVHSRRAHDRTPFRDIRKLLECYSSWSISENRNRDRAQLDVIKTADWMVDLGPEGGEKGGQLVVSGTPEQILRNRKSFTAQALARDMKNGKVA